MQYSTGMGEVKTHTNYYNPPLNVEFIPCPDNDSYRHVEVVENEAEIQFKNRLNYLIKRWELKESNKQDIKFRNLSKIENFLSKLVKEYNLLYFRSIKDPQKHVSKIFFLKVPLNMSSEERQQLDSKIIDKCIDFADENDILDTFMDTAIILER